MNKFFTTFLLLIVTCVSVWAQAPQKMTYQSVVRDVNNSLVTNRNVSARIWILQGSAEGIAVYVETQSATTNANGLITLILGDGTASSGSLSAINWANGPYYLKTEMDPEGGSNYSLMSVQELLSVPYALYANEAANSFSGDYNDLDNLPQIPQIPAEISAFTNDAGYLTPATVQDAVTIPTNVSAFTNDAGYITPAQVPVQVNADWNATEGAAEILNKPTVPAAANDATLTLQQNGTLIGTFTADASSDTALNVTVPTATDQLANDIGYLTPDSLPANVSTFTNDAGYLTTAQCGDTSICEMANMITSLQSQIGLLQSSIGQLAVVMDYLEEARFTCGTSTVKDFDNNVYNTVQIGNQCWMKENLRTTHYADGSAIPTRETILGSAPFRYYPNNDISLVPTHGYLYNWMAAMHSSPSSSSNPSRVQGACPAGWHIPSQAEWTQLKNFLIDQIQYGCGGVSTNVAKALASTTGWDPSDVPCTAGDNPSTNDATGFAALPTGYYYNVPYFSGSKTFFWSAEQNNDLRVWGCALDNDSGTVVANLTYQREYAFSVRCLRDVLGMNASLPTVTTYPVMDITPFAATCGGEVTADGGSPVTARGVCWGTSQNPTLAGSYTTDSTGVGSFTRILTDLTPGTTYYVRAYATNSVGTVYGEQQSFTALAPTSSSVVTLSVGDITYTSATCVGGVTSEGNVPVTERGFCWSTSGYPMANDNHIAVGSGMGSFTATITGLNPGTEYYVRAYAISYAGTVYGELFPFATPAYAMPTVVTTSVSDLTYSTAVCGGEVTADGGKPVTARGVCWSSSGVPTVSDNHTTDGEGVGSFTSSITGLTPGTIHYVRAYATNSEGTKYGLLHSFITPAMSLPIVLTASVSDVTITTAVCGGEVTSEGDAPVTARGVCWSSLGAPTLSDSHTTDGEGLGSFTSSITGLEPSTIYYVRAYAVSSVGTRYGLVHIFITPAMSLPTVVTTPARDITLTSGVCGGEVTSEGDAPVTERGVCWCTNRYPTVEDDHIAVGSGLGSFTTTITGLDTGTMYNVRAYAISSAGIVYGDLVDLTTLSVYLPDVLTDRPSDITYTSVTCGGEVISDGNVTVTERGICWTTYGYPTVNDNHVAVGSGMGRFTTTITGLTPGTKYYVRAYATNSAGTNYGNLYIFTARALALPSVTTDSIRDLTHTTATCGGEVTDDGGSPITARGVCWSRFDAPLLSDSHTTDGDGIGSFTSNITGLKAGTFYFVRAYATNSQGTMYGDLLSITTPQWISPTVVTAPPSDIAYTSATCGGEVTLEGDSPVVERGICWTTYGYPTVNDNHIAVGSGLGSFTTTITGLATSTGYNVRAYAISSVDTVYGIPAHFATLAYSLPTVITATASDITLASAVCGGEVTVDGGKPVTARGVCWSTSANPTVNDAHTTDGAGIGSFTSNLTGLVHHTTYYVRAYATNSLGTAYGQHTVFITSDFSLPTVITNAVSDISSFAVTCSGEVTSEGDAQVIERGFCWSTYGYPTVDGDHVAVDGSMGSFTATITGLAASTSYRVRAYATSSMGTAYGNLVQFTTPTLALPTVIIANVTDITHTTAVGHCEVMADGHVPVTARGICWSTSQNPTLNDAHTTDSSGTGAFNSFITGLTPHTLYYVRAYATNSVGTAYSLNMHFYTPDFHFPAVTTVPASDVTYTSATCGGEVTSEGDGPVTERGICWATSGYPTVNDNRIAVGGGLGSFTTTITGLTPGTTYIVRAYAINSGGVSYGSPIGFHTPEFIQLPVVTTAPVTDITNYTAFCGGEVTDDGGSSVTLRGVCWSTHPEPTLEDPYSIASTGMGTFTTQLSGLIPGTTYYVRAYATNSMGTAYGAQQVFTTTVTLTVPGVIIGTVSNVTHTSATCSARVVNNGNTAVTASGVCWSVTNWVPTLNDNYTTDGASFGEYTSNITGLTAGTMYHVRAYATNSQGTSYSSSVEVFTTPEYAIPTVLTNPINDGDVTLTAAICGGNVTDEGDAPVTERGICWSNSTSYPTIADNYTIEGGGSGSFSVVLADLPPNNFYFVRAFATNSYGTAYGEVRQFYVRHILPWVVLLNVHHITATSAIVNCFSEEIQGLSVLARGVCWSTSPNPTVNDNHTSVAVGSNNNFSSLISDLNPATTYYVRSYATNEDGTAYSDEWTFTTMELPMPTISDITCFSATFVGEVTGGGDASVTARGFCWGTSPNPTLEGNHTVDGDGVGVFSHTITDLFPNTTYYVRMYATKSEGTSYGQETSFSTFDLSMATVATNQVSDVYYSTATCSGTVSDESCAPVTARGFCWNTSPNPTIEGNHTIDGIGLGEFSHTLTALTPTTTYHVRAYATTSLGTSYGDDVVFTTYDSISCDNLAIPYACNFTNPVENLCWTIVDANGDGSKFRFNMAGYVYHVNYYNETNADDYLISPTLTFTGNPTVVHYKKANIYETPSIYEVFAFGPDTVLLLPPDTFQSDWIPKKLNVSQLNGDYAIAFHCISEAHSGNIEFSDFRVYEPSLPDVETKSCWALSDFTAKLTGILHSDGGAETEIGFCWSTSPNPTLNDNHVTSTLNQYTHEDFNSVLADLIPHTHYYVRAYATNFLGTVYGDQVDFITKDETLNGLSCVGTPTVTDVDNNTYNTVWLGGMCWMKENLRTTHYADNTPINYGGNNTSTTTAYRYYPGNNSSNVSTYGYLYNWAAVMHGAASSNANPSGVQGICPTGWHVPSAEEWSALSGFVYSHRSAYACYGSISWWLNIAKSLASNTGWISDQYTAQQPCSPGYNPSTNNATNFSALPAGCYAAEAYFGADIPYENLGKSADFWSSALDGSQPVMFLLLCDDPEDEQLPAPKYLGASVRCVRDY